MKFLFVDSGLPAFDRASADLRMATIVRLLGEAGHDCTYLALDTRDQEQKYGSTELTKYEQALTSWGCSVMQRIGIESVLARNDFDVVYFKYFYPAEHRIRAVRAMRPCARIVVDSVDLVFARLEAKAAVTGDRAERTVALDVRSRELATYSAADVVITVTDDEKRILEGLLPGNAVFTLSNIHSCETCAGDPSARPTLIFVGVFSHEPNVDAVLHFALDIWPTVKAAVPDVQILVVGGSVPPQIAALSSEDFRILGYVPDLQPLLTKAWVSVAPLRFGAGMKGKVGEAMAAGLPVVTTSFGAEGFGAVAGRDLLVHDSPTTFAAAVVELLNDASRRAEIADAGRRFIAQYYSIAATRRRIEDLTSLLAHARANVGPLSRIKGSAIRTSYLSRAWLRWYRERPDVLRPSSR